MEKKRTCMMKMIILLISVSIKFLRQVSKKVYEKQYVYVVLR